MQLFSNWRIFLDISKFFTHIYGIHISYKFYNVFVNCSKFWSIPQRKLNFVSFKLNSISRLFYKSYLLRKERNRLKKKPFYFRLDTWNTKSRFRKLSKKFISIRLIKLFFMTLTHRQFRKLGLKSKKKDGFFEQIIWFF